VTREFVYTAKFDREWNKLGLSDDDLRLLELYLIENPNAGKIVEGTGSIRKMRWALPNKGKSGGIRILFIDFIVTDKICMFDMFQKSEKVNLSQREKSVLRQIVKTIGEEFRK